MLGIAPLFLLLAILVSPSQARNATCGLRFQEHIQKVIDTRKDCGYATFNNCCEMQVAVNIVPSGYMNTGVYDIYGPCRNIKAFNIQSFSQARCDMDSDNGGWLVIQRRVEGGTVDFNRGWSDYEKGFGNLEGEFWYGLRNIHCLTKSASMDLRMDMESENGNKITWTYTYFYLDGPEYNYRLHLGGGRGTPGTTNPMSHSNYRYFSTKGRDNDQNSRIDCASYYKGGWWYYSTGSSSTMYTCTHTNPNGVHDRSASTQYRVSSLTTGNWVYYPNFEMKIRPRSCAVTQASSTCS